MAACWPSAACSAPPSRRPPPWAATSPWRRGRSGSWCSAYRLPDAETRPCQTVRGVSLATRIGAAYAVVPEGLAAFGAAWDEAAAVLDGPPDLVAVFASAHHA